MKKKLVFISLFVVLGLIACCLYTNSLSFLSPAPVSNSGVSTSTDTGTDPSIFLSLNKKYFDLNIEEKDIVNSFFENNPQSVTYLRDEYGAGENYKDELKLRFYGKNFAIFYFPASVKGGYAIMFYDIANHQSSNIGKDINVFGNSIESDNYIVLIDDKEIKYLKAGDASLSVVENSALHSGETYVKQGGFGNTYEATLEKNVFIITVFKQENGIDMQNTKLREVEFVLK